MKIIIMSFVGGIVSLVFLFLIKMFWSIKFEIIGKYKLNIDGGKCLWCGINNVGFFRDRVLSSYGFVYVVRTKGLFNKV